MSNVTQTVIAKVQTAKNNKITNLSVGTSEVSHSLSSNLKQLMIRCRGVADLQIAFTATETATKYLTIPKNSTYEVVNIDLTSSTLYLLCSVAGQTAEIMEWY